MRHPCYEAIDIPYFGEVKIFPKLFLINVNHPKEPQNIPNNIKKNIEKSHYKKVYMRRWLGFVLKYWFRGVNRQKTKRKYLFQGNYKILNNWFYIDIEWIEENFSTREPQFYKSLFQSNIEGQSGSKHPTFSVPTENEKDNQCKIIRMSHSEV